MLSPFLDYCADPNFFRFWLAGLFSHTRVGQGGKSIKLYKFRSMVRDADEILHKKNRQLLAKFKKSDWKLENDPRITRLGKVLRALTIDEFPNYSMLFKEI